MNVGGKIFATTKTTLCKVEGCMLAAMFSGRHQLSKGPDGAYFIDRSPKHFETILNFLRDGDVPLPDNKKELLELEKVR